MFRMAILIIFIGTLVGALMPSGAISTSNHQHNTIQVSELEQSRSPSQSIEPGSGSITLHREWDGHFYVDARVNGATVHFLVDTGASVIALTESDARSAGLAFDTAQSEPVGSGASGEVYGHYVRLNRVELGLKSVTDSPAIILEGGDRSLLGQSFLSKFGSVEIHNDTMVLR
jgi:aspartyl protease family protein